MNALLVAAAAAYLWMEIVIPGFAIGLAFGPNDLGQVAVQNADGTRSGIWRDGTFTLLPAPPAGYTVSGIGINDAGVITGIASTTSNSHEQGFILVGSTFTFFSRPGWANTEPRAIGTSGLVTGHSFQDTGESAGFVYDPSTGVFTDVTPSQSTQIFAQGINKFGRISGSGKQLGLGHYAFVWQQGQLTSGTRELEPFLEQTFVAGGNSRARGINDNGVTVGFTNSGGMQLGFVGNATRGYQLLVPPGADAAGAATSCEGINNFRQVVCDVTDASGNTRAFIGTPEDSNGQ
jgi:hypothetical protein